MTSTSASPPLASGSEAGVGALGGKKTRSKTGCGTCKGRRKSCDEQWDPTTGSCQRCKKAGYSCRKDTFKPPRRRRPRGSLAAAASSAPLSAPPAFSTNNVTPLPAPQYDLSTSSFPGVDASPSLDASSLLHSLADTASRPSISQSMFLGASPAQSTSQSLSEAPAGHVSPLDQSLPFPAAISLFAAPSPIPPDLVSGLINTTSASADVPPPAISSVLPNTLELDELMAWLSSPETIEDELSKFSEEWWGFYVSMVDAFFYCMPSPQRKAFLLQLNRITGTNALGRTGIAAWCCSTFAHHLRPDDPQRRDWMEKAERYYDRGVIILTENYASYSLNILLSSVIDLRLAKLDSHGAAAANHLLDLGDFFVSGSRLKRQIDMRLLGGIDSVALRLFIYVDVFRAVVTPGRPLSFELVNLVPTSIPSPSDGVTSEHLSVHYSLSVDLLICISTVITMINERGGKTKEELEEVAAEMDANIRACKIRLPEAAQSSSMLSYIASQEMWRQAALIFLYTSYLHYTPLSRVLRTALNEILLLSAAHDTSSTTTSSSNTASTYSKAALAGPWFLVATIAVTEEEREVCLQGIEGCGAGKLHRDNKAFVVRFWEEIEKEGKVPDWREFAKREGMSVAFM